MKNYFALLVFSCLFSLSQLPGTSLAQQSHTGEKFRTHIPQQGLDKNMQKKLRRYLDSLPAEFADNFQKDVNIIKKDSKLSDKEKALLITLFAEAYYLHKAIDKSTLTQQPDVVDAIEKSPELYGRYMEQFNTNRGDKKVIGAEEKQGASSLRGGEFDLGKLAYSIPDTMFTGQVQRVELSVARTQNNQLVLKVLSDKENAKVVTIDTGDKMKASLEARNDGFFRIESLSYEEQLLSRQASATVWQWDVTPLKGGQGELMLKVSIVAEDGYRNIPVFDKKVQVIARSNSPKKLWLLLGGGGGLLILGLVFWQLLRRRNKQKEAAVPEAGVSTNTPGDAAKVKALIKNGETRQALESFLILIPPGRQALQNEVIELQARLSLLERDLRKGRISREQEVQELNRIHEALLELLAELREG